MKIADMNTEDMAGALDVPSSRQDSGPMASIKEEGTPPAPAMEKDLLEAMEDLKLEPRTLAAIKEDAPQLAPVVEPHPMPEVVIEPETPVEPEAKDLETPSAVDIPLPLSPEMKPAVDEQTTERKQESPTLSELKEEAPILTPGEKLHGTAEILPQPEQLESQPEADTDEATKHDLNPLEPVAKPRLSDRTITKQERRELREAAEQSRNIVLDLALDGVVRWVSSSWLEVTGMSPQGTRGKRMAEIIDEPEDLFANAIEAMKQDDTRSHIVTFKLKGQQPKSSEPALTKGNEQNADLNSSSALEEPEVIMLEAQGIMVYDRGTGTQSHTMWMVKPFQRLEITIDLPISLVESLGIGTEVLAKYLTDLAESGDTDPANHPPPMPILCRICEREITPWWFEKHSELCLQEHKAEMDVQMAQEGLSMHRESVVKVMDVFQARPSRPASRESLLQTIADYKGMPISPSSGTVTHPTSGTASPMGPPSVAASREASMAPLHHFRSRSVATTIRPNVKKVELMLDLIDTALSILTPSNDSKEDELDEADKLQLMDSEKNLNSILSWKSLNDERLGNEPGLRALVTDTEQLATAKADAVVRYQKLIEYSTKIRDEDTIMVENCINDALNKADRIVAGEDGESDEDHSPFTQERPSEPMGPPLEMPHKRPRAVRSFSEVIADSDSMRNPSPIPSTTNSPIICPTPRSSRNSTMHTADLATRSHRYSMYHESEANDSDASTRNSLWSANVQSGSPATSESDITRVTRSRDRKRSSLLFAGSNSPRRFGSPDGRRVSNSPLRIAGPDRHQRVPSPMHSPLLLANEILSPITSHSDANHHRRQASVQYSEYSEAPQLSNPSPRHSRSNRPKSMKLTTSIKDFEIIKPISKGAFGSVHLAKKRSTGDYYAIKALNKADMKAKNQISNVRAERAIMMRQTESDFVAKLLWAFADRSYLYLVMEYMNGGDVAALVKSLGGLSEDWAKSYMAEVVLGVQHLHQNGIVHRDLKPDNLLIDSKGHLKLTDFGLSRMGMIKRQKRVLDPNQAAPPDLLKSGPFAALAASNATSRSASNDFQGAAAAQFQSGQFPFETPLVSPELSSHMPLPTEFNLNQSSDLWRAPSRPRTMVRSESGDSEYLSSMMNSFSLTDSSQHLPMVKPRSATLETEDSEGSSAAEFPLLQPTASTASSAMRTNTPPSSAMPPPPMPLFDPDDNSTRRFVGTPDYLAPETINGTGQDERSDWWSVGCILFELLFGYPPFHAQTFEAVFERILARQVDWPEEDECPISPEAKDLINKLICSDPNLRLGNNSAEKFSSGGDEIRAHPWFADIKWDTLLTDEPQFIPAPQNPEDTEYFDPRGAVMQNFVESTPASGKAVDGSTENAESRPYDAVARPATRISSMTKRGLLPLHIPPHVRENRNRRLSEPVVQDDFGAFTFKNLGMLEKANQDIIQRLKADASSRAGSTPSSPAPQLDGSPTITNMPVPRQVSINRNSVVGRPASPSVSSSRSTASSVSHRLSLPASPLIPRGFTGQRKEEDYVGPSSRYM